MMHGSTMRPVAHCGGTLRLKGISNLHQKKSFRCKPNLHRIAAQRPTLDTEVPRLDAAVDDSLSNRPLALDSGGYFIIKLDRENREIVADFYTNIINKNGLACDPETGEVIPCTPGYTRPPSRVFRGRTAKEISVRIIEEEPTEVCTHLVHANYLGREFQRAEFALLLNQDYIQD